MDYFAGLDVSLETANICIVDADGDILSEKKVEAEPAAIIAALKQFGQAFKRIGLEAGPTSSWLYSELHRSGYPAIRLPANGRIQADASDRTRVEGTAGLPPGSAGRAVDEYLAVLDDAAFGTASEVTPKFI